MIKEILSCTIGLFMLTSCASMNDADMSKYENLAIEAIAQTESKRIDNVNKAHSESVQQIATMNASGEVKILGIALLSSNYKDASENRLGEILKYFKRDKKGTDVQDSIAGFTGQLITGAMTFGIVREVVQNQPTVNYSNEGDVIDSGNRTDSHTTTAGDGNQITSTVEKDKDESSTEIIEPTITE